MCAPGDKDGGTRSGWLAARHRRVTSRAFVFFFFKQKTAYEISTLPEKLSLRREIEVRIPGGQRRYLGISVSPLRTRDTRRSGFVFNFQDLTELRRLEQEVATKERMAAVWGPPAAIAHEIPQPSYS